MCDLIPVDAAGLEASAALSPEEQLAFQAKIWQLLAKRTALYTMDDSSSVPIEMAQELLTSVLLTLSVDTNHSAQIRQLLDSDLDEKFAVGLKTIEEKIECGKELWRAACLNLPSIENTSLTGTLKSIGACWKRYDYRFFAHQVPCDIDYQLCHAVSESLLGIDYINEYLRHILIENRFLCLFDPALTARLLRSYCPDYRGLLINLFEPVATNALGLALIGTSPRGLDLSDRDRQEIAGLLQSLPKASLIQNLTRASARLCTSFGINRTEDAAYLEQFATSLYPRIEMALAVGDFKGIFLPLDAGTDWTRAQFH